MPTLAHMLRPYDHGFIRLLAEAWALDTTLHKNPNQLLIELTETMGQPDAIRDTLELIDDNARLALSHLMTQKGRLPWQAFTREYGDVRPMGAGKREREAPHLSPISSTEQLWYRGLIGKAFMQSGAEPQEFAYIPDEIYQYLRAVLTEKHNLSLGVPAFPDQIKLVLPAGEQLLDEITTLIAAMRLERDAHPDPHLRMKLTEDQVQALLSLSGVAQNGMLDADATRAHLEQPRSSALQHLFETWRNSPAFDELALIPTLTREGNWTFDAKAGRQAVIDMLSTLPGATWFDLDKFIENVRHRQPDFLRPAANYEGWILKDADSGEYLKGFPSWDKVEGRYLRFLLTGPVFWFGLVDLAAANADQPAQAFRISSIASGLLSGAVPTTQSEKADGIKITSRAVIRVDCLASRSLRYQIARFCDWLAFDGQTYIYRVSGDSLQKAAAQGLSVSHLLALLKKALHGAVPPGVQKMLHSWEAQGTQAYFETMTVLRLSSPEAAAQVLASEAGKLIREKLSDTTFAVDPRDLERLQNALADAGLLAGIKPDNPVV